MGAFVTHDHEIRSVLCCIAKLVEGMVQDTMRLLPDGVMFNCGDGVDCEVQMPKPLLTATATNLLKSAETATECQFLPGDPKLKGALFVCQVAPEFVEV